MRPRSFAFSAFLAISLFCSSGFAQDQAAAEALFRSAQEAAGQGDWRTACERFEESNRLEPAPGTVLNIGRCREKLGQLASAWKSYGEAAQRLEAGDKRARFARNKAEELEPRVPYLTLLPPESEAEFTVLIRDVEFARASLGVALPFDPGPVTIVVRAEGRQDFSFELELSEGSHVEQRLELGALLAKTPEQPAVAAEKSNAAATASFVVAGAGAGLAIFGGVWSAVERGKVGDSCPDRDCGTNQEAYDASVRGRTAVVLLATGAGVALVGAGLGTYFLLQEESDEVALAPRPGGGILTWKRTW